MILECPVMSETTVFFEWKRGEDPVEDLPRFKVFEETGVLKIKNAKMTDSGIYVCNAVNGYGQINVHVRLEVMTVEQYREKNGIDQNKFPVDTIVTLPPATPKPPAGPKNPIRMYKPYLVNTKLEEEVMKYEGENVTLPCKFEGRPTPEIRWYFKGEPLSIQMNKTMYSQSIATEGDFTEAKIMIPHVSENSTGRFTCQATNKKGSKSANIHLVVFPDTRPEIIGDHPLNSTFVEGQTITLYCRVRCTEEPSIQWIRKKEFASTPITGQAIKKKVKTEVVGSKHKPEVEFKGNNLYESILTIPDANISDAGIYVCTAMNVLHQSIAFREAGVHVIHASERYETSHYMTVRSRAAASRDPQHHTSSPAVQQDVSGPPHRLLGHRSGHRPLLHHSLYHCDPQNNRRNSDSSRVSEAGVHQVGSGRQSGGEPHPPDAQFQQLLQPEVQVQVHEQRGECDDTEQFGRMHSLDRWAEFADQHTQAIQIALFHVIVSVLSLPASTEQVKGLIRWHE